MGNVRNGNERRAENRGTDRRAGGDMLALSMRHLANAERIIALLTFPPLCLATEADKRRAEAETLAEENTLLLSLIMS